jgi:hypothetical protein
MEKDSHKRLEAQRGFVVGARLAGAVFFLQGKRSKISASVILQSRHQDEPKKSSGAGAFPEKIELFSDFHAISLPGPSASSVKVQTLCHHPLKN